MNKLIASSPLWASFAFSEVISTGNYLFRAAWQTLWNLVFPPVCVHCGRVGEVVCHYCQQEVQDSRTDSPSPYIDRFTAIGVHTGWLRSAVHALKYEHEARTTRILGKFLAEKLIAENWSFDIIIPVPLHVNRLKERGYNQANLIAQSLLPYLESVVMSDAIIRDRETISQVGKTAQERRVNVSVAFSISPTYLNILVGKSVLLIDDVCTTGSTLEACAIVLQDAGVSSVMAATVSRAQSLD